MTVLDITAKTVTRTRMELVTVTPDLASEWLLLNTHNRPVRPGVVNKYATDMRTGLWRHETAEPLAFDTLGRLQDGQHRLEAVIKSGCAVRFWVMFGADPDDFRVINSGAIRSSGDVLAISGVPNGKAAAAIARNLLLMLRYPSTRWSGQLGTRTETVELAGQYRIQIDEAVRMSQAARKFSKMPPAQYGAVMAYVMLKSETCTQLHEFHDSVVTGEMLQVGDPVFALRRWAISRPSLGGSASNQMLVAYVTKAWNDFAEDRKRQVLIWRSGEALPLPVPARY